MTEKWLNFAFRRVVTWQYLFLLHWWAERQWWTVMFQICKRASCKWARLQWLLCSLEESVVLLGQAGRHQPRLAPCPCNASLLADLSELPPWSADTIKDCSGVIPPASLTRPPRSRAQRVLKKPVFPHQIVKRAWARMEVVTLQTSALSRWVPSFDFVEMCPSFNWSLMSFFTQIFSIALSLRFYASSQSRWSFSNLLSVVFCTDEQSRSRVPGDIGFFQPQEFANSGRDGGLAKEFSHH